MTGPSRRRFSGPPRATGLPPVSRRQMLGMGATLAAGAGLSPLLAACGSGSSSSAAGKTGGTLTMGIAATPDTLDPGATGLALTLLISLAMFDPLVWWLPGPSGSGSQFVPGLAESYTVSPDAAVYTFKLRKDVTFHDGTKFDATAVKATYDHVVDPATKSKSGLGALGPYQETKILDPYTVQIIFKQPNASFLHQQAAGNFGIASPTALAKYGPTGFGNHPVGSGPFMFSSYATGNQLTLVKNPAYKWGPAALGTGPAKLDKLVFRIVTDDSGRYNALQSGQLQIAMNLPPNDIAAAKKSGSYQELTVPSIGTPSGMPINVTKPPTNDPLVRQAILYAVDQDKLVNQVLFGVDTPAHSVLTPITPGYSKPSASLYSYDPAKASALLSQAGWNPGPGGVRTKNGQKLSLNIILFGNAGFELPTQFVVSELSKVGFTAQTAVQPFATAQGSFNAGAAQPRGVRLLRRRPVPAEHLGQLRRDQVRVQLVALRQPGRRLDDREGERHGQRRRPRRAVRTGGHAADEGRDLPAAVGRERRVHHVAHGDGPPHHAQRLPDVPFGDRGLTS